MVKKRKARKGKRGHVPKTTIDDVPTRLRAASEAAIARRVRERALEEEIARAEAEDARARRARQYSAVEESARAGQEWAAQLTALRDALFPVALPPEEDLAALKVVRDGAEPFATSSGAANHRTAGWYLLSAANHLRAVAVDGAAKAANRRARVYAALALLERRDSTRCAGAAGHWDDELDGLFASAIDGLSAAADAYVSAQQYGPLFDTTLPAIKGIDQPRRFRELQTAIDRLLGPKQERQNLASVFASQKSERSKFAQRVAAVVCEFFPPSPVSRQRIVSEIEASIAKKLSLMKIDLEPDSVCRAALSASKLLTTDTVKSGVKRSAPRHAQPASDEPDPDEPERRRLIEKLLHIGAEFPITVWADEPDQTSNQPTKLKPRWAKMPLQELRSRVETAPYRR